MSRVAWLVIAGGAIELAGRQVARRSLWAFAGVDVEARTVLILAALAAVIGGIAVWRRSRPGALIGAQVTSLVLGLAFVAGLFAQLQLGARLQSDGFFYFSYLRSLWFDGDVNFTNDYPLLGLTGPQHQLLYTPTPTGHAQTAWSIGPAVVWSPFFAAGHVVARTLHARGHDVAIDGTSFPYRQAICIAGLFYGLLGAWCCWRLACRFFPSGIAAAAAFVTIAGSFMLWYLVKEPSMSHAPSMAAVAAFLWMSLSTGSTAGVRSRFSQSRTSPTVGVSRAGWMLRWGALGLIAGLMMAIRWQNALFLLLPALELAALRHQKRTALKAAGVFAAATALGFAPQMFAWLAIYGRPLAVSPISPRILWTDPHIVDVLWSSRNGLFALSPALYAAAIGLPLLVRLNRRFGLVAIAITLLMIYLNASVEDWWGGAGFGGRRFDSLIPLFVVATAALFVRIRNVAARRPAIVTGAVFIGLLLWNLTFMSLATSGAFRIGQPLAFETVASGQAAVAHRWFGHPFSWPLNLLYAVRYGVAPWRYDVLGPGRFLADPTRPYGRVDVGLGDEPFLEEGWHAREQDGPVTFRWAEREAVVLVPLDRAATLRLQLRVQPLGYAGSPPQQVTVTVNGNAQPPAPVGPGWNTIELTVDARQWRTGVNRVRLQFAWAARPADVGLGGDQRELAAQVDYVRVQVVNP